MYDEAFSEKIGRQTSHITMMPFPKLCVLQTSYVDVDPIVFLGKVSPRMTGRRPEYPINDSDREICVLSGGETTAISMCLIWSAALDNKMNCMKATARRTRALRDGSKSSPNKGTHPHLDRTMPRGKR